MKILLLSVALMVTNLTVMAQVGIGTTAPRGALDVASTTSGFLMPRMTTVEREVITVSADQTGMQVYDTTTGSVWMYDGTTWQSFTPVAGSVATLIDPDADTKIEVETTADGDTVRLSTAGIERLQIDSDGNVGIGTTTPDAKLDVNGDFNIKQRYYFNTGQVTVPAGAGIANSVALPWKEGITTLDSSFKYIVRLMTSGTGTYTGAYYIAGYNRATTSYEVRLVNRAGVGGNHPKLGISGTKMVVFNNHRNAYPVEFYCESFEVVNTYSMPHVMGADYQWQRDNDDLYYTDGNVGIGTNDPKAALDVASTTSGFLMPRMTTVERAAITVSADQTGMQVYDTTTGSVWLYDGTAWVEAASLGAVATLIDPDADTKIEVETTADDDTIRFTVAGTEIVQMNKDGIVVELERSANSSGTGYYHGEHKTITRSGTDNETGTKGLRRLVKKTGNFNSLVLYGVDSETILEGGGTTSWVAGNISRMKFLGTETQTVDGVARGYDSDIRVDNPNFTGYAQGVHNTLDLRQGHITGGDVIFMDFDIPGHSSADLDVTGDLTYLVGGGGSDVAAMKTKLEAIGKKFRFIHNQGTTESDFAGIINYTGDVQNIIDASGDVLIPKKYLESLDYVVGTGTINYLPRFTATGTVGNSQVFDDGTNVGIGTTSPGSKLAVVGLPGYASDAVASTGGLVAGDFYQTSSHATLPDGVVMVKQ